MRGQARLRTKLDPFLGIIEKAVQVLRDHFPSADSGRSFDAPNRLVAFAEVARGATFDRACRGEVGLAYSSANVPCWSHNLDLYAF